MRHMRIATLIVLPLALGACSASTFGELEAPPDSITRACATPVTLPEGDLTQAEVEVLWGRDRSALRSCGERHGLLVQHEAGQRLASGLAQ